MDRKPGAIFDWDGVIINSAAHHELSWDRLAKECGKPLPENHFKRGFGMKNERIIPELLGWTTVPTEIRILSLRKEAIYREIVREQGIDALPVLRLQAGAPVRTDSGNLIYDAPCETIADPAALAGALKQVMGVVEHGLFLGLADRALVGTDHGVITLHP